MSEEQQLPSPLEAIESRLLARRLAEPPPELRRRTLAAARAELQAELRTAARSSRWSLVAATAAAALLLVNLSLGLFTVKDSGRRVVDGRHSIDATAQQLRELLPELSEAEARRSAFTWRMGTRATWSPGLAPDANMTARWGLLDNLFD
jgi:hypothetical protein